MSRVTDIPAASSDVAITHFERLLSLETDCWDVHASLPDGDFVLLDVRGAAAFAAGHIPGAVSLPHNEIDDDRIAALGPKLLVVYCAGPHCNGADRAAALIARLGRPVKKMIGGVTGWLDEGFALTPSLPAD